MQTKEVALRIPLRESQPSLEPSSPMTQSCHNGYNLHLGTFSSGCGVSLADMGNVTLRRSPETCRSRWQLEVNILPAFLEPTVLDLFISPPSDGRFSEAENSLVFFLSPTLDSASQCGISAAQTNRHLSQNLATSTLCLSRPQT